MEYKVGDIIWLDLKVMDVKRGGFGIVYICYSNQWEHMVAAKSFQDKYLEREEIVQGFYREAEILMKLGRHPNIINAIQIIHPDNKPHILLEYIGGGSLTDWVKEGCRDVRRSLDFAIQFCEGMIYLNSLDMGGAKWALFLGT